MMRRDRIVRAIFLLLHLICSKISLSESGGSTAPMEETEKEALYLTIQGFVGNWWNGSELYPDPCGWTPIQGVSCDLFDNGMWYVTDISIGPIFDNSLKCSKEAILSPYLFQLNSLKSLSIISCFSSKPTNIPHQGWNQLSSTLERLEFRSNEWLIGEIPPVFGQLRSLQSLVLTENSLTGELPWELGNLLNLKRLTLSANRLTGQLPVPIGVNLSNLLIMDLSRNSLVGPLRPSIGGLISLLKLDLSHNLLNGSLPGELSRLKNLTILDLARNNLTGGLNPSLRGMASLEDMLLSKNPLGGTMQDFDWQSLQNLTHLDLSDTNLAGEIPNSIAGLKKLRFLALGDNQLSGSVSPMLAAMPCLTALYLNGNRFRGELGFAQDFYERMGRRFACWGNPNLCYNLGDSNRTGEGPAGVDSCVFGEHEWGVNGVGSEDKLGKEGTLGNSKDTLGSFGLSASFFTGVLWVTLPALLFLLFL